MGWFRKYFIPHQENDFKPHALQTAAVVGMMLLVLISFSIANIQSLLWISSDWLVSTVLPAIVTEETNAARAGSQLQPLKRNALLDQAAQMKAEDMAYNSYFAHTSPTGLTPWHWFEAVDYRYAHAGENLAVHFTDSKTVVEAWLKSPSHRANIMNQNYREIGIGTAKGRFEGYDTVFVVQMFGAPAMAVSAAPDAVPASIEPAASLADLAGAPSWEESANNEAGAVLAESDSPVSAGVAAAGDREVSVTDDGTVVYESFASIVDPEATLAAMPEGESVVGSPTTFFGRLATSPRLLLQIAYTLIGLFVIAALTIAMFIEWRRQHPVQIAYSAGLLLIMTALFHLHTLISNSITIA